MRTWIREVICVDSLRQFIDSWRGVMNSRHKKSQTSPSDRKDNTTFGGDCTVSTFHKTRSIPGISRLKKILQLLTMSFAISIFITRFQNTFKTFTVPQAGSSLSNHIPKGSLGITKYALAHKNFENVWYDDDKKTSGFHKHDETAERGGWISQTSSGEHSTAQPRQAGHQTLQPPHHAAAVHFHQVIKSRMQTGPFVLESCSHSPVNFAERCGR